MRVLLLLMVSAMPGWALTPAEIVLIVNKNEPASAELAAYYAKARAIPAENIITLDLPKDESISRKDYDQKLHAPLRTALKDRKETTRCLVCMYGVPLRVGGADSTAEEKAELAKLAPQIKEVEDNIAKARDEIKKREQTAKKDDPDGKEALLKKEREQELKTLTAKQQRLIRQRSVLSHAESTAAVDSELMMLWWEPYPLVRWQINLNHWQVPASERDGKAPILLACRLDGPDVSTVKRMIDDAISTEKVGLSGKVYVDARGIKLDAKSDISGTGYGGYDQSMRDMAELLRTTAKMDVILDDKEPVFLPNTCPDAALYCGWYSHAKFVDSATFKPGAIAWHLASSEAVSLRKPGVTYWCPNLLAKGVCATLGPVSEPYTIGFPKPAEFFGFLATGQYTLAECYGKTVYFTSWMGTLIGDPLYNPYKANPKLKESDLFVSPKGVPSPFKKS